MSQYAIDTYLKNGHLELDNIPFPDDIEVKVCIIPKVKLSEMSFNEIRQITKSIKGNLSDDIDLERDER